MRKYYSIIFVLFCLTLLTGCAFSFHITKKENTAASSAETYISTLENHQYRSREYLAFYGTKVLYVERDSMSNADFYLYDCQKNKPKKLASLNGVSMYYGTTENTCALLEDTAYFYFNRTDRQTPYNTLYAVNFSKNKMYIVEENEYSQNETSLTAFQEQIIAIHHIADENKKKTTILEAIDSNGKTSLLSLAAEENTASDTSPLHVIQLDSDGQILYALETTASQNRFFLTKYDSDLTFLERTEISKTLNTNQLNGIREFRAFDDCFYVRDLANNAIICKSEQDNVATLIKENNLIYIPNLGNSLSCAYFFKYNSVTAEIYSLDFSSGEIVVQNLNLNNDTQGIKSAFLYDSAFLVIKGNEENDTLYLSFAPFSD